MSAGAAAATNGATGGQDAAAVAAAAAAANGADGADKGSAGADGAGGKGSEGTTQSLLGGAGKDATGKDGASGGADALPVIEVKLPDGAQADPKFLESFKELGGKIGLDSAKAQALVDYYFEQQKAGEAASRASWEQTTKGWSDSAKSDKEYGGEKFSENMQMAMKAINKFGTPGLTEFFNSSMVGSHPEMVRFAYRVGKAMAESSVAGVEARPVQPNPKEALLKAAYPTMHKEKE